MNACNKITNFLGGVVGAVIPKQGKPVGMATDVAATVFTAFAYTYFGPASAALIAGNYLIGRVTYNEVEAGLAEATNHSANVPARTNVVAQRNFSAQYANGECDEKHGSAFSVADLLSKLEPSDTRIRTFLGQHVRVTDFDALLAAAQASGSLTPDDKGLIEGLINSLICN